MNQQVEQLGVKWFFKSKWKDKDGVWRFAVYQREKSASKLKKELDKMSKNLQKEIFTVKSEKNQKQKKTRERYLAQKIKAGYREVWL